jgi:hypothetical protein
MRDIRELELHVANACNLTCESCSHFSNDGHRGILGLDEADSWMKAWNRRIRPKLFCLLGGEPTLNPQLADMVLLAGKNWPESQVYVTTNGFFLHRHPSLPQALKEVHGYVLVSIHDCSQAYWTTLSGQLRLLREWQAKYKFDVYYNDSYHNWTRRYKGQGPNVLPYTDHSPRSSWENCAAKFCTQLFRGKIWKCSTITYLQLQKESFPTLSSSWDRYLAYEPLDPNCTDEDLDSFFSRQEEDICNMCPAKPEPFIKPSPIRLKKPSR